MYIHLPCFMNPSLKHFIHKSLNLFYSNHFNAPKSPSLTPRHDQPPREVGIGGFSFVSMVPITGFPQNSSTLSCACIIWLILLVGLSWHGFGLKFWCLSDTVQEKKRRYRTFLKTCKEKKRGKFLCNFIASGMYYLVKLPKRIKGVVTLVGV